MQEIEYSSYLRVLEEVTGWKTSIEQGHFGGTCCKIPHCVITDLNLIKRWRTGNHCRQDNFTF